jgi:hypothetical protein
MSGASSVLAQPTSAISAAPCDARRDVGGLAHLGSSVASSCGKMLLKDDPPQRWLIQRTAGSPEAGNRFVR